MPMQLGSIDISLSAPEISFTVWAKLDPMFGKGYILRKRLKTAGYGADLSCWGWYLDKSKGPEVHYGNSCDFFPCLLFNDDLR